MDLCFTITFRLEGETIAAQSKEAGVAVARSLDAGKKLVRGVHTTVLVTAGFMLVFPHGHARSRRLANVHRCAVAAKNLDR